MTLEKEKKHFSGAGNNQNMLVRIEVQDWRRICGRQFEIRRHGTENGGAIPAAEVSDLRRRGDCGSIVVTGPRPVMFKQLRVGRNGHASRCTNLGRRISIVQHMPDRQSPRTIRIYDSRKLVPPYLLLRPPQQERIGPGEAQRKTCDGYQDSHDVPSNHHEDGRTAPRG